MSKQAGGNPRFKGPGSSWKSSWRGRSPFTEMCCIDGFSPNVQGTGQFYTANNVMNITAAQGSWFGFIIGLTAVPAVTQLVARNGALANQGWQLRVGVTGPDPRFDFIINPGAAGGTASVIVGFPAFRLDPTMGVDVIFYRVLCCYYPGGNGTIRIFAEGASSADIALAAAYANASPVFQVGVGSGVSQLEAPNCVNGIVGGRGNLNASDPDAIFDAWSDQIAAAYEISAVPAASPAGVPVPNYLPENGWKANYPELPVGDAPNPFLPFIGSANLVYAVNPSTTKLQVHTHSPSVFAT